MCSVTFHPLEEGFRLAMNRDEQRDREVALSPKLFDSTGQRYEAPHEKNGGTWIAHDREGNAWCLMNWYEMTQPALSKRISRGIVIPRIVGGESLDSLPLESMAPFRLIAFSASDSTIVEWRWDGDRLEEVKHDWAPFTTASSGWNEPEVARSRKTIWEDWLSRPDVGTRQWLLKLHQSHEPEEGAHSFCMHRDDAASVSCTLIEWRSGSAGEMSYLAGQPCEVTPTS